MKYDFDKVIDRSQTDTIKWSKTYLAENFNNADALPLWVADMDFQTAQPIIDALTERAQHGIFGYGEENDALWESVINWQQRRNGWKIEKEWLLFSPGIVPGLQHIIGALCSPGENVLVQSPVYYPFFSVIKRNRCNIVNNQLLYRDGQYEMDFEGLEDLAKDEKTRMLILCSPHNPVGRVWKKEELTQLARICKENDVLVVADEIHSDLIYPPHQHTSFGKVAAELQMDYIACVAPSKTFNLAGLQISDIIVPNEEMRAKVAEQLERADAMPGSFSSVAQIAAYNHGEEWLEQLLEYIQGNMDYIEEFLATELPRVKFRKPEGTYLAWLDFSDYGMTQDELEEAMQKAGLALDSGYIFGKGGETWQRVNCACPRSILEQAMERFKQAVD